MGDLKAEKTVTGWAARDPSGHLSPYHYTLRCRSCSLSFIICAECAGGSMPSSGPRRRTGAEDVVIKVLYCGVCHTDLHEIRNELGRSRYPMVPGHEVVGMVSEIGEGVKKFKVGEHVGVGYTIGSCGTCERCNGSMEQFCKRRICIYNDVYSDGKPTQGGFASAVIVHQKFVVRIPENLPLEQAAAVLCAGVTVYSPMKHFGMTEPGKRCGILGLGGVGHMGVKIAKAFGLHVTVVSSSERKKKEAFEVLGADAYLVSKDAKQMQEAAESLDYILDTIPAAHPVEPYLSLLRPNGKLVMLGAVGAPLQIAPNLLILNRLSVAGSFIGGIQETQEVLDFCAEKKVSCMTEVVGLDYVNEAMERLEKNDVRYRFVLNVGAANLGS